MFGGFGGILPLRLGGSSTNGLTAEQHARIAADLVALKRTSPFAVLTYTTTSGGATLDRYHSMVEIGALSDSAPSVSRTGTGIVTITWPSFQEADEFDVSGFLSVTHVEGTGHGSSARKVTCQITGTASLTSRLADGSGTATDGTVTLEVY